MKRYIIVFAATCVFCISTMTSAAFADTSERVAVLKCDKENNKLLVRFGLLWNEGPLDEAELSSAPPEVKQDWPSLASADDWLSRAPEWKQKCTLASGRDISVSVRDGYSNSFFTFIVDGKIVYYNYSFFDGKGDGRYVINSLIYEKNKLSECQSHDEVDKSNLSLSECSDVSARLMGDALSVNEKQELEKRSSMEKSLSSFCKNIALNEPWNENRIDMDYLEKIGGRSYPGDDLSSADIDINNDGKIDKVFKISADTHYFSGSYLIAFTKGRDKVSDFLHFIKENGYAIDVEPNIKKLPKWKAYFISLGLAGSSARYVYNDPFSYKGRIYIYSSEKNWDFIPSKSVSEITANNGFKTLCEFP